MQISVTRGEREREREREGMHDIGSPHTSNVGTGVRYVCALAVQVHVLCFVVLIVVARAGGGA